MFFISVIQFPSDERISSVKLISLLPGTTSPVGVIISSNNNQEGHMHLYKVHWLYNFATWNIPAYVEYLASSNAPIKDNVLSPNFRQLNNIEAQYNFVDIFTGETWDNNYGMRRLKLGSDVQTINFGEKYCKETGINIDIRMTNPVKILINTYYRHRTDVPYTLCGRSVNGVTVSNGQFYLGAGNNFIKVKAFPNHHDNRTLQEQVKVDIFMIPMDETDFSASNPNRRFYSKEKFIDGCNTNTGCPFVYVYDGQSYQVDNNILHRNEFAEYSGLDITDNHLLNIMPFVDPQDSTISLKIEETANDYSYFDQFKLISIDHPAGSKLGITENNEYVVYFPDISISPCFAQYNNDDVTGILQDDEAEETLPVGEDEETEASFYDTCGNGFKKYSLRDKLKEKFLNALSTSKKYNLTAGRTTIADSFALVLDAYNGYVPTPVAKRPGGSVIGYNMTQDVMTPPISFANRQNKSVIIVPLTSYKTPIDSASIDWGTDAALSFVATNLVYFGGYVMNDLTLVDAMQINNNVTNRLIEKDQGYADMGSNSSIELKFKVNNPDIEDGWVREYVLVTEGRYIKLEGLRQTNISGNESLPTEYRLLQNYPNPFNPVTKIKYELPKESKVTIVIYDILGREIAKLINNDLKQAGRYEVEFSGKNFASGIYFYKLVTDNFVDTKRMVLIK